MRAHRLVPATVVLAASVLATLALAVRAQAPVAHAGSSARSAALASALRARPGDTQKVWVFFRDKGPDPSARMGEIRLTTLAIARRARRGATRGVTVEDVPLLPAYASAVAASVTRVRQRVAWLNAMSVEATADQIEAIERLPFVAGVDVVRGYRRRDDDEGRTRAQAAETPAKTPAKTPARSFAFDYGPSTGQLTQIGVPAAHDLGLHGEGVMVAVFDTGFDTLFHEAFAAMSIVDRHDFVNGDDDVANGGDRGEGSHGTATLSVLGGYAPGHLIGPAFNATFLLAKTEDTSSETPVEEDNWAAAAEWAEARGADVISSSLGYLTYDPGFPSYTADDMNGQTAISTHAADLAGERGVVVVNSAGNAGPSTLHNTLGAPADGRLVLTVGAVTSLGLRATFSSVGPTADGRIKPDVAAQGVAVITAAPGTPSGYTSLNGTSFSCPLTAGVVALVLQARPSATVSEVEDVLRATASQAAQPDNLLGWGIVNAGRAVQVVAP
jgi:subtilisin family serine protease